MFKVYVPARYFDEDDPLLLQMMDRLAYRSLRVITIDGDPWGLMLSYSNAEDAVPMMLFGGVTTLPEGAFLQEPFILDRNEEIDTANQPAQ